MAFPNRPLWGSEPLRRLRKAAVHVLVLTELRMFRRYAYVRHKEKLVRHVPGIAMHRDDQRLRERRLGPPERIDEAGPIHHRFSRLGECLVGFDIDTSEEMVPAGNPG